MRRRTSVFGVAAILVVAGATAACGGGSDGSSPDAKCADVWKLGETLSAEFTGCDEAGGPSLTKLGEPCDGHQAWMYGEVKDGNLTHTEFFARAGGKIEEWSGVKEAEAWSTC